MSIYHNHHIIPTHAGGSDDSSNQVLLTIIEHAEAHRVLYEKYGRLQDKLAWKGLSGQISKEEITKELQRMPKSAETKANMSAAWKIRVPRSAEWRAKISIASKGRQRSIASRAKQSASLKGHKPTRIGPHSIKTKAQISASMLGKQNSLGIHPSAETITKRIASYKATCTLRQT